MQNNAYLNGWQKNLGSIEIVTPSDGIESREPIRRMDKIPTEAKISQQGNIPLQMYPESAGVRLKKLQIKISEQEPNLTSTIFTKIEYSLDVFKFQNQ